MTSVVAPAGALASPRLKSPGVRRLVYGVVGLSIMLVIWELGTLLLDLNPATRTFTTFGPGPTFRAFPTLIADGSIYKAVEASGYRLGFGLLLAIAIGIPIGILMGRSKRFREMSNSPFQLLRMISPLAWMPIAVMAFETWDSAIIFLLVMATVWPIIFSTAHGVRRIDPNWFKVARNLGASGTQMLRRIILPAIMTDVMAGIRLAVGVAWVVLVPAEYLGVTSGLGYAINDARDTLSYDYLAAVVLVIGIIGYGLDSVCNLLIKRFNWHVE